MSCQSRDPSRTSLSILILLVIFYIYMRIAHDQHAKIVNWSDMTNTLERDLKLLANDPDNEGVIRHLQSRPHTSSLSIRRGRFEKLNGTDRKASMNSSSSPFINSYRLLISNKVRLRGGFVDTTVTTIPTRLALNSLGAFPPSFILSFYFQEIRTMVNHNLSFFAF